MFRSERALLLRELAPLPRVLLLERALLRLEPGLLFGRAAPGGLLALQPIETLAQAVAVRRAARLDVPRAAEEFATVQAQLLLQLPGVQRRRHVLLVREDQEDGLPQPLVLAQAVQLVPRLLQPVRVGGIYDEDEAPHVSDVVVPEEIVKVMAEVARREGPARELDHLENVMRDHLAQLELVEGRRLARAGEADQEDGLRLRLGGPGRPGRLGLARAALGGLLELLGAPRLLARASRGGELLRRAALGRFFLARLRRLLLRELRLHPRDALPERSHFVLLADRFRHDRLGTGSAPGRQPREQRGPRRVGVVVRDAVPRGIHVAGAAARVRGTAHLSLVWGRLERVRASEGLGSLSQLQHGGPVDARKSAGREVQDGSRNHRNTQLDFSARLARAGQSKLCQTLDGRKLKDPART